MWRLGCAGVPRDLLGLLVLEVYGCFHIILDSKLNGLIISCVFKEALCNLLHS